ncbi:glycosyltransferase family A protein [Bacillus sp. JJ722]|uniref:glycosyltransferase family A protein n=1 Tax=Bacillus sp. JJ722 TaxID=3122973 RepID=UPI002FFEEFF7
MKVQVLLSTMFQTDYSLLKKVNIQSDAIVVNQCDYNKFEEFNYDGYTIQYFSFNERGVGLSRNTALMRADGDICIFADDDLTYVNNYKEIILGEFKKNPQADIIVFNVPSTNNHRPTCIIRRNSRVKWYNSLRYGAVNIAIRTEKIKRANIYFSLLFGGGAKYSAGEDSLFIMDSLRKGLKIYASSQTIGYVKQEYSSWFEGYTEKYFFDKGVFFACLSKRWAKLLCLYFVVRHRKMLKKEKKISEAIALMIKGTRAI